MQGHIQGDAAQELAKVAAQIAHHKLAKYVEGREQYLSLAIIVYVLAAVGVAVLLYVVYRVKFRTLSITSRVIDESNQYRNLLEKEAAFAIARLRFNLKRLEAQSTGHVTFKELFPELEKHLTDAGL